MKRVLLISDQREVVEFLSGFLNIAEKYSVQSAMDTDSALHRVRAWKPHLVFLEVRNEGSKDTLEVIPRIRSLNHDAYTAIILISKGLSTENFKKALDLGVDYFLRLPFE